MGAMKRLAGGSRKAGDGFHVDFSMFVDRKGVMERVDHKTLRVLSGTGSYARSSMRNSIKASPKSKKSRTVTVNGIPCFIPPRGKVLDARSGQPVRTRTAALAINAFRERARAEGVGKPPRRGPSDLLRKRIFFGVEADTETVVIGPEMFAKQPALVGATSVPQLLDQGGKEHVRIAGVSYLANYEPRPFVGPQMPIAQKRMAELIEEIPL